MNPDSKSLTVALTLALVACVVMIAIQTVRPVGAEDDCAFNTWSVTRAPVLGLVCIGEPRP